MAGTVWRVENLIVEDGEVQGKTKTDGVSGSELGLRNVGGSLSQLWLVVAKSAAQAIASYLVGLVCGSRCDLALLARRKFGEIAVVIALPVRRNAVSSLQLIVASAESARKHTSCGRRPWTRPTRPWE